MPKNKRARAFVVGDLTQLVYFSLVFCSDANSNRTSSNYYGSRFVRSRDGYDTLETLPNVVSEVG